MSAPLTVAEMSFVVAALDRRMLDMQQAHAAVHVVSEQDVDRRLGEMNKLRAQIESERGLYMTRDAVEARIAAAVSDYRALAERNAANINALERAQENWQGRLWAMGAGLTFVVALAAVTVKFL